MCNRNIALCWMDKVQPFHFFTIFSLWHFPEEVTYGKLSGRLTLWRLLLPYGYSYIKHPVPDRLKLSFIIFDIRALWKKHLNIHLNLSPSGNASLTWSHSVTLLHWSSIEGRRQWDIHTAHHQRTARLAVRCTWVHQQLQPLTEAL